MTPAAAKPIAPRAYLLWLAAVLVTLYVLPMLLLQIPSFERWGGSGFGPALDYGFSVRNENADVLLFGDSTAAVGLDPLQLSSEIGLKALNLPNTGASLHVTGDRNLQLYLQHNRRPRLIVFIFAPWNLDFLHEPPGSRIYEGEEMLARHGTPAEITRFARLHAADSLQFPFRFYAANPPASIRSLLRGQDPAEDVARTRGHADPLARRPPLPAPCKIPLDQVRPRPTGTVEQLIRTYRSGGTDVLVYLPPMPACDNVGELLTRDYTRIQTFPPQVLPAAQFKLDFTCAHLLPSAVPGATHTLAELIRRKLQLAPASAKQ